MELHQRMEPEMDQAGPGSLKVYLLQKTGSAKKTYSSNQVEGRCLCRRTCKSLDKEEIIWGNLPVAQCFRHSCARKTFWSPYHVGRRVVLHVRWSWNDCRRSLRHCNTGCLVRYPYLMHCKFILSLPLQ